MGSPNPRYPLPKSYSLISHLDRAFDPQARYCCPARTCHGWWTEDAPIDCCPGEMAKGSLSFLVPFITYGISIITSGITFLLPESSLYHFFYSNKIHPLCVCLKMPLFHLYFGKILSAVKFRLAVLFYFSISKTVCCLLDPRLAVLFYFSISKTICCLLDPTVSVEKSTLHLFFFF